MTSQGATPISAWLTCLFHIEFPDVRREVLTASAEAIGQLYPQIAELIKNVMESDPSTPGRSGALQVLKHGMKVSGHLDGDGSVVPLKRFGAALARGRLTDNASPSQVFVRAVQDWSAESKSSLFREFLWEWGMGHAAHEMNLPAHVFEYDNSRSFNYHRSLCREITGEADGFANEAFSLHYYRTVALIGVLDGHYEAEAALKFMHWLECNDVDLKSVLPISKAIFDTPTYLQAIDPEQIEPILHGDESIILVNGML